MKQAEKIKNIKLRGREKLMIHKTWLDPDGDPCIKGVPENLQKAHMEAGWEILTPPPIEAKTIRKRKPKTVKDEPTSKES